MDVMLAASAWHVVIKLKAVFENLKLHLSHYKTPGLSPEKCNGADNEDSRDLYKVAFDEIRAMILHPSD